MYPPVPKITCPYDVIGWSTPKPHYMISSRLRIWMGMTHLLIRLEDGTVRARCGRPCATWTTQGMDPLKGIICVRCAAPWPKWVSKEMKRSKHDNS